MFKNIVRHIEPRLQLIKARAECEKSLRMDQKFDESSILFTWVSKLLESLHSLIEDAENE